MLLRQVTVLSAASCWSVPSACRTLTDRYRTKQHADFEAARSPSSTVSRSTPPLRTKLHAASILHAASSWSVPSPFRTPTAPSVTKQHADHEAARWVLKQHARNFKQHAGQTKQHAPSPVKPRKIKAARSKSRILQKWSNLLLK